ncbi:hypothetical protein QBC35DRAFT_6607 [Podospora australis]|uniref:Uncharacterized protein n=1 Tax=Podospora australis TaxID=1536484 RepID=A0AAN6X494_9PEZI|nr:hypothetical protein QBC35DRAFT_6607 [Podospora australis]
MASIPEPVRSPSNGDSPVASSPGRHPSISLQAAATLNASLQRESPSRRSSGSPLSPNRTPGFGDRRRSQVLTNLQIADPAMPAPGEMLSDSQSSSYRAGSPSRIAASPRLIAAGEIHHHRAPSLGEIHQELENEQEFQVNRLLAEIRRLQEELEHYKGSQPTPGSEAIPARPVPTSVPHSAHGSLPRSPVFPRASFDVRRRSRTPSRGASPRLRATSISGDSGEQFILGGRDESAFYQAETQMLTRENQMLKHRIKELERQLNEGTPLSAITHEPSHPSHLTHSTSVSEEESLKPSATAA